MTTIARYKREVSFLDAENHIARLDVEVTDRNGYPEFTVSGRYMSSGGQVRDHIKPANDEQKELMKLWSKYHLKDVSKHVNFIEHVDGVIARIEYVEKQREAAKEKLEGDEALLERMEQEGIDEDMLGAVKAYISLGIESNDGIADFEEAYQGEYSSDADFARNMADSLGAIDDNATWPHQYIDWEAAARDLMQDYLEADGYYFGNI